jgi:hypothetical protein
VGLAGCCVASGLKGSGWGSVAIVVYVWFKLSVFPVPSFDI